MFKSTIKIFFFLFLFLIKNAYANNFAISTSHPIATKVGKNILHNGGSAIDAVIGVQMVLNLVEPQSSGIGGGGFLLYFDKLLQNHHLHDIVHVQWGTWLSYSWLQEFCVKISKMTQNYLAHVYRPHFMLRKS